MSKESIQLAESILKSLAILIAGLWVIFKFIINRDHSPKIQFELDVIFLGRQDGKILIEVVAKLLNKGKVRHVFDEFNFDIYTLNKEDEIVNGGEDINYQVRFKKSNPLRPTENEVSTNNIQWVAPQWNKAFVDPDVEKKFSYLTSIEANVSFICIFCWFQNKGKNFHTAQKTFSVEGKV